MSLMSRGPAYTDVDNSTHNPRGITVNNKTVRWQIKATRPLRLKQEFLDLQEFCHAKITSCGPDGGGGGTEVTLGGQDFSWKLP